MNLAKTINLPNSDDIRTESGFGIFANDVKNHLKRLSDELRRNHRMIYDSFISETLADETKHTGTFTNGDGDTVTVENGIITDIS